MASRSCFFPAEVDATLLLGTREGAGRRGGGSGVWTARKAPCLVVGLALYALALHDGKAAFAKHCAKCHGDDGLGQTPAGKALKAASLVDPKWAAPDAVVKIEAAIRDGVPRMPAMQGKLTGDEITAAAKYTQQLAGGKP